MDEESKYQSDHSGNETSFQESYEDCEELSDGGESDTSSHKESIGHEPDETMKKTINLRNHDESDESCDDSVNEERDETSSLKEFEDKSNEDSDEITGQDCDQSSVEDDSDASDHEESKGLDTKKKGNLINDEMEDTTLQKIEQILSKVPESYLEKMGYIKAPTTKIQW